ncbi:MAG: ribosomal protein S18-alanine N-acetyltransferase [Clostridia bacterium]|nr:ribosomal protein S18-alanine N-acetyltransferase [Clostridia bacterium]
MRYVTTLKQKWIDGIAAIEQVSFADPWSRTAFESELTNPLARYAVAVEDETVLAYGGFWKIVDEAHITNVAVAPQARRQGLGRAVMQELIRTAKEEHLAAMTLEARVSNRAALALYESLGFHVVGVRPGYYANGEDAAILWLEEL